MWHYLESLSTFADYPLATAIHWCQGAVAGFLFVYGHKRKHPELAHYALVIILLFLVYEALASRALAMTAGKMSSTSPSYCTCPLASPPATLPSENGEMATNRRRNGIHTRLTI